MFVSTDFFTVTSKCGYSTEYHDVNHSGSECGFTTAVEKKRFHQYKTAHIMSSIIFLLVHIILPIAYIDMYHYVDAFSLPSYLSHLRYHSGVYLGNKNMMQTSSILLMTEQSTKSDNTASTSISETKIINPAATPSSSSTTNEYSFFDEATIYIRAGSGGQGSSTYKKGVNNQNGPPDGGNGGRGGDVILELDESLNTLAGLARYAWRPNSFGGGGGARRRGDGSDATSTRVLSFRAENGVDGARQNKQGRNGKDVIVRVPPGTVVQEEISSQTEDGDEPMYIDCGTITTTNPTLKAAFGGEGGEGSSAEKLQRGVRRARTPPQGGERKRLKLTLKVVADVSVVSTLYISTLFLRTHTHTDSSNLDILPGRIGGSTQCWQIYFAEQGH